MEFEDVVRRRATPTSFGDRPIARDAVDRILDCGRRGPSAGFSQGFEFLVLEGPEDTERYWDATAVSTSKEEPGLRRAPVIIVPLAHKEAYIDRYAEADKARTGRDEGSWPVPYWLVDTSFAAALMLLAAVDEGLGACLLDIEDAEALRKAFMVPAGYFPIGAIAVGHEET